MERSLARIALFAALIAALGFVPKIDMGFGVPITAQTLGVMLCGTVLGARSGALAVLLFMALALLGLPILAGGRNGFAALASPSVGFFLGFPVAAFVTGWLMTWSKQVSTVATFNAAVFGGIVTLYLFGIPGIAAKAGLSLTEAFWSAMVFVPGDVIKAAVAALVTTALARARPGLVAGAKEPASAQF
ncbi:biotin transporter BioY [Stagnihabitans tardus]|uniref:Biotin transporter n=1 Tax=Stagnihabitans tardus TaxID=2699202 RepID=A0AAE5BUN4_9RHOB|nr:biotin transporter BioY [Stagnihabitans tardus]NBZ86974.1 BioY family transporter [Stagnihabitans tardus]